MKKFFIILIAIVVILLLVVFGLLFTAPGNGVLKPIIEKKATEASGMDVKLDKLALRVSSLDVEATVAGNLKAKVSGPMSIFSQTFDLDYDISADKIPEIDGIKVDGSAHLNGKVNGALSEFNAAGSGDVFDSSIDFDTKIKDFKPINAVANVKNLEIAKVLALLNQPVYSSGVVSLEANIVPNANNELEGTAKLLVDKGLVHEDIVLREFNVTLPKNTNYNINGNFNIQNGNDLVGQIVAISSLATLKTTKTTYDINSSKLFTDFNLNIDDLSKFNTLAGLPLSGKTNIYGNATYALNDMKVNALSDNLVGGKLNAMLDNDKLNVDFKGAKLENILKTLVMPEYSSANIDVSANLESIQNLRGQASVVVNNGVVNNNIIKKEFNQTLPNNTQYNAGVNAVLDNGKVNFNAKVLSTLANINELSGTLDINKTNIESKYSLDVPDLSKFSAMTGQEIKGNLSLNGIANLIDNALTIKANSDNFAGGKLDVGLQGDTLVLNVDRVKVEQLLAVVAQPIYASGDINAKVNLTSLSKKDGSVSIDVTNGLLNQNTMIKEFNLTIPKTDYSVNANVNLKDAKGTFNSKVLSTLMNIDDFSGSFDINNLALDSKYQAKVENLSNLNSITGQNMIGSVAVDGTVKFKDNVLQADGKSNIANGTLNFDFTDGKLNANGKGISTVELLKMLSYPDIFTANIDANFNYNIMTSKGEFSATAPTGHLKQNQLGLLIEPLLKIDITKEVYKDISMKGDLNKELIRFNFDMSSENTYFKSTNARINAGVLNIPLALKIKNRDLKATLSGPSSDIKVSIDSSEYLKEKAAEEIGKHLNVDNSTKEAVGNILNKLFK